MKNKILILLISLTNLVQAQGTKILGLKMDGGINGDRLEAFFQWNSKNAKHTIAGAYPYIFRYPIFYRQDREHIKSRHYKNWKDYLHASFSYHYNFSPKFLKNSQFYLENKIRIGRIHEKHLLESFEQIDYYDTLNATFYNIQWKRMRPYFYPVNYLDYQIGIGFKTWIEEHWLINFALGLSVTIVYEGGFRGDGGGIVANLGIGYRIGKKTKYPEKINNLQ